MAVAARGVVLGDEAAPKQGLEPEDAQVVGGDLGSAEPDGIGSAADVLVDIVRRGDRFELGRLGLPVQEDAAVGDGKSAGVGNLGNLDEAVGVGVRQRLQQQGVDDAEDRGVRADAEREREHGHQDEAGRFGKLADREAEIGEHGDGGAKGGE